LGMIRGVGPFELLIVLVIVLVVFGAGKLTGVGGAVGRTIREFREEARVGHDNDATEVAHATTEDESTPAEGTGKASATKKDGSGG